MDKLAIREIALFHNDLLKEYGEIRITLITHTGHKHQAIKIYNTDGLTDDDLDSYVHLKLSDSPDECIFISTNDIESVKFTIFE